jgi:TPP-dependent pyruvate/acetoin dehydrogenase alpha subunit
MQGRQRATACFFGEGAVAEGEFHESLNLAALWKLPVLFFCENNLYAMGTALSLSESEVDLHLKAASYRIPSEAVDGMDVVAAESAAARAAASVRAGGGPHFVEFRTYRFRAHSMFDPQLYRTKAEVEEWKKRDPIARFGDWLQGTGAAHADDLAEIESEVAAEIADAVAFAEAGMWESAENLTKDVYAERAP